MPRALLLLTVLAACRRVPPAPARADAASGADPLAGVIDPWSWPRAQGATARERAVEDIGPWEPADPGDPRSPPVNVDGDHWTRLADLAWERDVSIVFDREPVDLDGDGVPDTRVTRRLEAHGGILGDPAAFGLVATPDDPRGRPGRVSASAGVLGVREALDREGKRTGLYAMTCWLCHGGANPVDGRVVLGLANARFDYGALLATSSLLDDDRVIDPALLRRSLLVAGRTLDADGDGRVTAGEYRRALGFSPGRTVRARLLLAGPGRQDLTGEFGLDTGVPGLHSARYPGTAKLRNGPRGLFNPVSVPPLFRTAGLPLQNWSGSEIGDEPWLERLAAIYGAPEERVRADFGLPAGDRALARRALLLDLRNLGTLGLQQDSFPGLLWSGGLRGFAHLSPAAARLIPTLYAAREVRAAAEGADAALARAAVDAAAVARGRALFTERVVGAIANRQVLRHVPPAYAAARLQEPVLAPIDAHRPIDARLPVRCADCHNASLLEASGPLAAPPLGRCSHCHHGHVDTAGVRFAAIVARAAPDEVAACGACHDRHRGFAPLAYTGGMLLPFDADGDGNAQGDEDDDARAGGIGTEALLSFDVPRGERPGGRFGVELPLLSDPRGPGRVTRVTTGVAWVRVAPLVGLFATAPYLHNGAVPTLRALLDPPARRPATFTLGRFTFDTRVPGNRSVGHDFGTTLTAAEKSDLSAFLQGL